MKKSLILLAALLVSCMGFAQSFTTTWSKPTVKNFVDMADDGATAQYLWNVGAQGFFAGHNNYNTRASVALFGDSIRMKALEGTWNFGCYPAQYTNKNSWLYVSCNAWNAMWVDAGNNVGNGSYPGTDQWVVAKQENGSYKITNTTAVAEPGTFGVAEKCEGESPNTRCYIYDPTKTYIPVVNDEEMPEEPAFSGEFWDEWKFVSVDEYVNVYFPEAKRYDAAANLKKQIEGAMEKGIAAADLADDAGTTNILSKVISDVNLTSCPCSRANAKSFAFAISISPDDTSNSGRSISEHTIFDIIQEAILPDAVMIPFLTVTDVITITALRPEAVTKQSGRMDLI